MTVECLKFFPDSAGPKQAEPEAPHHPFTKLLYYIRVQIGGQGIIVTIILDLLPKFTTMFDGP
jgi:hypothetical protein